MATLIFCSNNSLKELAEPRTHERQEMIQRKMRHTTEYLFASSTHTQDVKHDSQVSREVRRNVLETFCRNVSPQDSYTISETGRSYVCPRADQNELTLSQELNFIAVELSYP